MTSKREGREVSRVELAEIFGVAKTTVDSWVQRGCPAPPSRGRGIERVFNTADVAQWLQQDAQREPSAAMSETEQELRTKKLGAEVALIQLALDRQRKAVAPSEEMEKAVALENEAIRRHLLAVPDRVASQLLGDKDEGRFKRILAAELVMALEKAAEADIDIEPDSEAMEAG